MNSIRILLLVSCILALLANCGTRDTKEQLPPVPESAIVVDIIGEAHILPQGTESWRLLKANRPVRNRDVIRTGEASKVVLDIALAGEFIIGEKALVSLQFERMPDQSGHASANARYGKFLANFNKLVKNNNHFTMRTPTATAAIRGTSFSTEIDPQTGESQVKVLRGKVAVKNREYKKTIDGKLVDDNETGRRAVRAINPDDPAQVAEMMNDLDKDWEHEVEKIGQQKVAWQKQQLEKLAVEQNLTEDEVTASVQAVQASVEEEVQAVLSYNDETMVEKGKTVEVTEERVEEVVDLTAEDVHELNTVFTEEKVGEALAIPPSAALDESSGVSQDALPHQQNTAPEILSQPPTAAYENTDFLYTIAVQDADSDELMFRLTEGPEGMKIAAFTGALTWRPLTIQTVQVAVEVDDNNGHVVAQRFPLQVFEGLDGAFSVKPSQGEKGTRFLFDGSESRDESSRTGLRFRWDFDGDGKWDYPVSGYTSQNYTRYVYKEFGSFQARMEIVNANGISQELAQEVVVDQKPEAVCNVTPVTALPGSEFTFDGGRSKDNGKLKYRWDFNGDGAWDWPEDGYAMSPGIKRIVDKSYTGDAVLEVVDALGQTSTARIPYSANYPCEVRVKKADKVNLVTAARLMGDARDKDGRVVEYAWDFDNDGRFDYTSDTSGIASFVYGKEGKHTAVFRAQSDDGSTGYDTVVVEVFNAKPSAKAGADVKVKEGERVVFEGAGEDPDGEIKRYEWDFDGDGEFDYSSTKTGRVEYSYVKRGQFKAKLRVTTKDGASAESRKTVTIAVP